MKRSFLITLFAPILMLASVSISFSQYTIIQLRDNPFEDGGAMVNDNGYVVWTGCDRPLLRISIMTTAPPG